MNELLEMIRSCRECVGRLPHEPRPIVQADRNSRIILIGQAPGRKVHASGIPWNDPSGDTLRRWLGVERSTFYDPRRVALVPMGFCYPGSGRSGDLPPRPECAPLWHPRLLAEMPAAGLILLIGRFAHARYLADNGGDGVSETVRRTWNAGGRCVALPHPSPRNRFWIRQNPWFETELLPGLRSRIAELLAPTEPAR